VEPARELATSAAAHRDDRDDRGPGLRVLRSISFSSSIVELYAQRKLRRNPGLRWTRAARFTISIVDDPNTSDRHPARGLRRLSCSTKDDWSAVGRRPRAPSPEANRASRHQSHRLRRLCSVPRFFYRAEIRKRASDCNALKTLSRAEMAPVLALYFDQFSLGRPTCEFIRPAATSDYRPRAFLDVRFGGPDWR